MVLCTVGSMPMQTMFAGSESSHVLNTLQSPFVIRLSSSQTSWSIVFVSTLYWSEHGVVADTANPKTPKRKKVFISALLSLSLCVCVCFVF